MAFGGTANDREPEARAGQGAGLARAVEALEDVGKIGRGDARPVVADRDDAVGERDLHRAVGGTPLRGVVEQVGHGTLQGARLTLDPPRAQVGVERERRGPQLHAIDRVRHDVGEVHRLGIVVQRLVARQLDEVADQGRELLDLGADVGHDLHRLLVAQRAARLARLGQELDVGAQAREGRAQLVSGVGHEAPLLQLRGVERGEHLVERGREARQLVATDDLDRLQLLRAGDVLGRTGEAPHGAQAVRGHRPAGGAGHGHAGQGRDDQDQPEAVERLLDRVHRLHHDQRRAGPGGHRHDPVRHVVDDRGAGRAGDTAERHGHLGVGHVDLGAVGQARQGRPALEREDLDACDVEQVGVTVVDRARGVPGRDRLLGAVADRGVEVAHQLGAHDEVDARADAAERQGHGQRGQRGHARRQRDPERPLVDALVDRPDELTATAVEGPHQAHQGGVSRST